MFYEDNLWNCFPELLITYLVISESPNMASHCAFIAVMVVSDNYHVVSNYWQLNCLFNSLFMLTTCMALSFWINWPSLKFLNLQVSIPNYFWSWQKCYWSWASGCSVTVHPWTKKKISKLNITGSLWGASTSYCWIPITTASNAESTSMVWHHHECVYSVQRKSALLMTCKLILIGINSVMVMAWDDQHPKCITLIKLI